MKAPPLRASCDQLAKEEGGGKDEPGVDGLLVWCKGNVLPSRGENSTGAPEAVAVVLLRAEGGELLPDLRVDRLERVRVIHLLDVSELRRR